MIKKSTEGVNRLLCIDDGSFHEHRVLKMLSDLFALHGIVESPGGFLEASSPSLHPYLCAFFMLTIVLVWNSNI